MSNVDVVRAWKDPKYRKSLSEGERALLPENPGGVVELTDADLVNVGGYGGEETNTINITQALSCFGNDCDDKPGGTFGRGTCVIIPTVGCC